MKDDFRFYIEKAIIPQQNKKRADRDWVLRGVAGDSTTDGEGESLDYNNFDLSRMDYVNWEHGQQPEDTIGVIIKKTIRNGRLHIDVKLFKDKKKAKEVWELANQYEEEGKNLGFSVEGKATARNPMDRNKVAKAQLYGVALCKVPVNPVTYAKIVKSLSMSKMEISDVEPLFKESVEKISKILSEKGKKSTQKDKNLTKSEIFNFLIAKFALKDSIKLNSIYNQIKKSSNEITMAEIDNEIEKAMETLGLKKSEVPDGMKADKGTQGGTISPIEKKKEEYKIAKSNFLKSKSELQSLCKAEGETFDDEDESEKSDNLEKSLVIRTNALGSVMMENHEKSLESMDLLKKGFSDLVERLKVVESTPIRKSVKDVNGLERFEGGDNQANKGGNQYDLRKSQDATKLISDVNAQYGDLNNDSNIPFLKAISELEMTKSMTGNSMNLLKSNGFNIINQ